MADEKTPKIPKKYVCEVCAFTSSNKKDYNKHLLTDKHKTNMNADKCLQITPENTPENCDKFVCMCGKSYKHRQSLFRHQTKCNYKPETTNNNSGVTTEFLTEFMKKQQEANAEMIKTVIKEIAPNQTTAGFFGGIAGFNLSKHLSLGYAYQGTLANKNSGISNTSHEFLIRIHIQI